MMYSDTDIALALCRDSGRHANWIRLYPPLAGKQFQSASVDLRLNNEFLFFPDDTQEVDMKDRKVEMERVATSFDGAYALEPGGFVLGSTIEEISLGPAVVGRIEGKSSLGRIGLSVHVTAGFIDPGFKGHVTLEMFNASPNTIILRPDMLVCQMSFSECTTPSRRPYGSEGLDSRYQGQSGVTQAKE